MYTYIYIYILYIYYIYMHDYAYTCCHTHQVPSYPSNECAPEVNTATAQEEVFQSLQIDLSYYYIGGC